MHARPRPAPPQDVEAALAEAADNARFLAPLRPQLEKLSVMDDFVALAELFKPIMHTVLLVWKHSGHYQSTPRMTTLLQEVCNDLIAQVRAGAGEVGATSSLKWGPRGRGLGASGAAPCAQRSGVLRAQASVLRRAWRHTRRRCAFARGS